MVFPYAEKDGRLFGLPFTTLYLRCFVGIDVYNHRLDAQPQRQAYELTHDTAPANEGRCLEGW